MDREASQRHKTQQQEQKDEPMLQAVAEKSEKRLEMHEAVPKDLFKEQSQALYVNGCMHAMHIVRITFGCVVLSMIETIFTNLSCDVYIFKDTNN